MDIAILDRAKKMLFKFKYMLIKLRPEVDASTRYWGGRFIYPSRSIIGQAINNGEKWDHEIFSQLAELFNDRSINIIEVGANIGASTMTLNKLFSIRCQLLVEPSDRYFKYLKENTRCLPGVLGIDRRIVGRVSNRRYTLKTNYTTGTPSNADYGSDETSSQNIESVTIDELAREYSMDNIDLLKVDTDGFEYEVFLGAGEVINRQSPLIFLEFSPVSLNRVGDSLSLIELLIEYGCTDFYVFSSSGKYLGQVKNHNEIMEVKSKAYYVDIVTCPSTSAMAIKLSKLISDRNNNPHREV